MDARLPPRLATALSLGSAGVVAFTGAEGKTVALYRLAHELAARRVLVTTTTRIWAPQPDQAALSLAADLGTALKVAEDPSWVNGVCALGTAITPDGKLQGIPPDWVAALARAADFVLVEADGAAGKPLTAPRQYEPVIPAATQLLVPVAGADVLGQALTAEAVHRPAEIVALLQVPLGTPLTAALVARVLLDRRGNVKGATVGARIVPLVNKVDNPEREAAARNLAAALLDAGASRVVLARLAAREPIVATIERPLQRAS